MITKNFINSAAQFLLVEACGCVNSISCFQDVLRPLKAFTLKVFKCSSKEVFFFDWQVYLLNSFIPFQQKQIMQPCHIELHLSCGSVPGSTPVFSTMEVTLNGCLAPCHPERLLHKTINCSILHRFALLMLTLAHWPEESRNYHVLCALISSCQIFLIFDHYSAVWLFHAIVIVYFSFYDQKSCYFVILWNIFVANLDYFLIK